MKNIRTTWQPQRLPAGALLLVITVSLIIAAILLSLILLATNRRMLVQRDAQLEQLRQNLASGLAYVQAHPAQPAFQSLTVDLFGDGEQVVQVTRKPWGFFDVAVIAGSKGTFQDTTLALLGSTFNVVNQSALYLTDENVPLAVNDDAQVRGVAWLPKAGEIRPASLPLTGEHRKGEAVVGKVHSSGARLPLTADSALTRLKSYGQLELTELLPTQSRPVTTLPDLAYSFAGLPAVWYHAKAYTIQRALTGQVVVISSSRLTVEATSQLTDVLLLAPTIIIKPGFRGRVQLIARDTVLVGADCHLTYPSAVCAYGAGQSALVSLGPDTSVQGVVVAAAAEGLAALIQSTPTTMVEGQVFTTGVVENCGTVRGTVTCRRLVYRGVGSAYENCLVNAVLDRTSLSARFLTSRLLNPTANSGVVAWLP